MKRFLLNPLPFALAFAFLQCGEESFTSFKRQSSGDDLRFFLEPGARTVIFPVVTRESDTLDGRHSSEKMEAFVREFQDGFPVIPFDDLRSAVAGAGEDKILVEAFNDFYRDGKVDKKTLRKLAQPVADRGVLFFLFLKLDRAELYRDTRGLYKKRVFVTGKLYYLPNASTALTFTASALSQGGKKENLPGVERLVSHALAAAAKGLPSDPKRAVRVEKEKKW